MNEQLDALRGEALDAVANAADLRALDDLRVKYLGRKGALTGIMATLGKLPPEEKPAFGQAVNELKQALATALDARKETLETAADAQRQQAETVDITLPGRQRRQGHKHVVNQVAEEIVDIFTAMGFQVASGPDIETEYYNFDALNTPSDHPARDSHDTFFINPGVVLRTHTSPVQMRTMERTAPPVAVIVPGRVYRVDYDASHSPMFTQLEGLLVDEGITFADLKGTLMHFIHRFFGPNTGVRFRPHFFPFTEPSAEVDISCSVCMGAGCRVCKHSGWLEILGCGMVHPNVFRYAGYDPDAVTGFAFGLGLDRIAMLRHAISSIGYLYENDLRFLEQF